MAEEKGFEPVAKNVWDGRDAALARHFAEERAAKGARDPLQLTRVPTSETRVLTSAEVAQLVEAVREIARKIGVEGVMRALAGRGTEWE